MATKAYAPMALCTYHAWPLWHMPPWHYVPTTHGHYGICPHGTVYLPLMATMAYAPMALCTYHSWQLWHMLSWHCCGMNEADAAFRLDESPL
eukprot:scaffold65979_cov19-Tisochrysis_lutea.AAC.2